MCKWGYKILMQRNNLFDGQARKVPVMKRALAFPFLLLTVIIISCEKSTVAESVPECIKANIKANEDSTNWYVGNVEEYQFQGKLVYAFNPDTKVIADAASYVLTSTCEPLCSVGGFGGPAVNLCNGSNFFQDAVFVRVVWDKYK